MICIHRLVTNKYVTISSLIGNHISMLDSVVNMERDDKIIYTSNLNTYYKIKLSNYTYIQ